MPGPRSHLAEQQNYVSGVNPASTRYTLAHQAGQAGSPYPTIPPPGGPPPGYNWSWDFDPNSGDNGAFVPKLVEAPNAPGSSGANAQLSYQARLAEIAENARHDRATEAEAARDRALKAASDALQAYTEGTRMADQRRLNAAQETRALLPFVVNPSQRYQAGLEPTGPLAGMARNYGLGYTPMPLQQVQVRPGQLAAPPPEQAMGAGILQGIQQVRGMGNA